MQIVAVLQAADEWLRLFLIQWFSTNEKMIVQLKQLWMGGRELFSRGFSNHWEWSRKTWDAAKIYGVKCFSKPEYVNNDIP